MFDSVFKNIIVATVISLTFFLGYINPSHNWDMIGYVASAFHMDGLSGQELLDATYDLVEKEVSEGMFVSLIQGDFRSVVYKDHTSLEQLLPFYTPRVLYIGSMMFLGELGVSYAESSYLVSSIFAAASVFVVALILKQFSVSIYLLPFVVVFSGLINLARYSTPDAMACFFALTAFYMLISGRLYYLVIAAILPLVRTDFVILSLLFSICGVFSQRKLAALMSGFVAILFYLAINREMGNYGWFTIFNFTLIDMNPYPKDMEISIYWKDYLRPYISTAWSVFNHLHGLVFLIALTLWLTAKKKISSEMFVEDRALWICFIFVVLHLLAFPAYMDRFFTFSVIICLIYIFSKVLKVEQS